MTFEHLVYFAQIAGSAALIFSLIFVGVQVRQNTVASRARTMQSVYDQITNYNLSFLDDDVAAATAKASSGKYKLQIDEFSKFFINCRNSLFMSQNSFYQYRMGLIDRDAFESMRLGMREHLYCTRGFRALWKTVRHLYSKDFRTYIDKEIEKSEGSETTSYFAEWHKILEDEYKNNKRSEDT